MSQFSMKFHEYTTASNVLGWYCFRKYNGWAAFWDGGITEGRTCGDISWTAPQDKNRVSSGLWSIGRDGMPHPILVPKWWTKHLPDNTPIQGELWYNDNLSYIKSTCGRTVYDTSKEEWWENIKFIPYLIRPWCLLPGMETTPHLKDITFQETINSFVFDTIKNKYVLPIATFESLDTYLITKEEEISSWQTLAEVQKWEGLVFINPKAKYELKTTKDVLKWKQLNDHRAVVKGYADGKGKYEGMCGSLILEIKWSPRISGIPGGKDIMFNKVVKFNCNLRTDATREWDYVKKHYPIGSNLEIQFNGVTNKGVPQHPRIMEE